MPRVGPRPQHALLSTATVHRSARVHLDDLKRSDARRHSLHVVSPDEGSYPMRRTRIARPSIGALILLAIAGVVGNAQVVTSSESREKTPMSLVLAQQGQALTRATGADKPTSLKLTIYSGELASAGRMLRLRWKRLVGS